MKSVYNCTCYVQRQNSFQIRHKQNTSHISPFIHTYVYEYRYTIYENVHKMLRALQTNHHHFSILEIIKKECIDSWEYQENVNER